MKRPKDKLIAGIDLHSNNVMIGVINQDGKRVAHRKLDCDLKQVTRFLEPLKPQLQSMAVESNFQLVIGWSMVCAPRATRSTWPIRRRLKQYNGIKHVDGQGRRFPTWPICSA